MWAQKSERGQRRQFRLKITGQGGATSQQQYATSLGFPQSRSRSLALPHTDLPTGHLGAQHDYQGETSQG